MKLPETQNASHQYAFKKGYRLAQEGKLLSAMPSAIRYDSEMREYFQQGWQQFQEDISQAEEEKDSPWRHRSAWFLMMLLAGIGTASLIIDEIKQSKQAKQPDTFQTIVPAFVENGSQSQTDSKPAQLKNDSLTQQTRSISDTLPGSGITKTTELSLLNDAARQDLILNQAEALSKVMPETIAPTLVISPLKITVAQLTSNIADKKATDNLNDQILSKNLRKLYFFTQIEGAKGQTVYHRWIFQNQILAIIPLKIQSNNYRTWSSKRMSSAWQGEWTLEVLNEEKQPLHRQTFRYIK